MKSHTKYIGAVITAILVVIMVSIGVYAYGQSHTIKKSQSAHQSSKSTSTSHHSQSSTSTESSSTTSSSSNSASFSSSSSVQSSSIATNWASLDLTHQIAILIQAAFAGQNGKPNAQFDFTQNYWAMTGSVNDGEIQRYVPQTDSFAGISDILSAKININGDQIQVTRPISEPFTTSLNTSVATYYDEQHRSVTDQIAQRVVTPARLQAIREGK
ncbi:RNA polymerase [Leuconostoc falkenbergense]|uniref:RNA polymerase n=1 Tax=Leuconostoc falkenbergense TaxID=2766470 RepID=UPI0024A8EE07|nr:RNA polymerase [Leuconostoc falkenbergense]MDI6552224.1 RNA polymerase [Leuconostoc falkenbergense]